MLQFSRYDARKTSSVQRDYYCIRPDEAACPFVSIVTSIHIQKRTRMSVDWCPCGGHIPFVVMVNLAKEGRSTAEIIVTSSISMNRVSVSPLRLPHEAEPSSLPPQDSPFPANNNESNSSLVGTGLACWFLPPSSLYPKQDYWSRMNCKIPILQSYLLHSPLSGHLCNSMVG